MFVGDTLLSLYCLAASTFDKGHCGIIVVNALDRLLANSPPDDAKVCQALHRLGSGQLCMPSTPTFPRPLRNAIFAVTSEYCCLMIVPLRAKTILKVLVSASERPALAFFFPTTIYVVDVHLSNFPCFLMGTTTPSRRCKPCRIKRRRCDLKKPGCSQCRRADITCPGYPDEFALRHRDETFSTAQKIKNKSNVSDKDHSNDWIVVKSTGTLDL